jgi:hypothetical protein
MLVLFGAVMSNWPEKQRLANEYKVSQDQVFIEPQPHGCDFDDAPLGNKYCHFKKVLSTVKDEQGKVTAVYVTWEKVQD